MTSILKIADFLPVKPRDLWVVFVDVGGSMDISEVQRHLFNVIHHLNKNKATVTCVPFDDRVRSMGIMTVYPDQTDLATPEYVAKWCCRQWTGGGTEYNNVMTFAVDMFPTYSLSDSGLFENLQVVVITDGMGHINTSLPHPEHLYWIYAVKQDIPVNPPPIGIAVRNYSYIGYVRVGPSNLSDDELIGQSNELVRQLNELIQQAKDRGFVVLGDYSIPKLMKPEK